MLLELADFYEVDIREIIDGERKSEQMNEELKETVIKVTDYTETNNARLLKRVRIIGITGVITILIAMVMDAVSPFWESVKRDLYAWTLGTLIANILYTTGWLKRISEKKDVSRKMRISGVVCAVIVIMSLILQAVL
jgi:predicted neutral ceramidase superfamily lipid hydrolase